MTAFTMFVLLALLLTLAESRPFNPILLNTQTAEATAPALYWHSVLPNTPMPNAIKELLKPDFMEGKDTTYEPGQSVKAPSYKSSDEKIPFYYKPSDEKSPFFTYKSSDEKSPFFTYKSSDEKIPSNDELLSNPRGNIFFLEKDMRPGKSMQLYFPKSRNNMPFIPREIANSIPFSSDKLSEIYNKLSIKEGSNIAETMKETINICEVSEIKGEKKHCATSLESMIDFSTSMLGKNVEVITTEVDTETPLHNYTFTSEIKKIKGDKFVVCHKLDYAYAVFYCHSLTSTKAYKVSMLGADGSVDKVAVMCHADTSDWDEDHISFRVLKVKPGTTTICHFIVPHGHILWANKN